MPAQLSERTTRPHQTSNALLNGRFAIRDRLRSICLFMIAVGAIGLSDGALGQVGSIAQDNRRCLNCHGQPHMATNDPITRRSMVRVIEGEDSLRDLSRAPETRPELYLGLDALAGSKHEGMRCISCHPQASTLPHLQELPPADCTTSCHANQASGFLRGAHLDALAEGLEDAPRCATCHGGHQVMGSHARDSLTHPLNIIEVCSDCHARHHEQTPGGFDPENLVHNYLESVHGHAVREGGLAVAATCADCHGYHAVFPSSDERSPVHREHVPQTCGQCHIGIAEVFAESVHGRISGNGVKQTPVCTDCHTAHGIQRADSSSFTLDIINECGGCHDDPEMSGSRRATFYETYRMSYHGQVTELGSTRAARCSDCHGAHDIRPLNEPSSRVHESNLINTCAECHPGANAKFVQFDPHADYRDAERYPLLNGVWWYFVIVMSLAFGFFGVHSVFWFIRSIIERIRHGRPPHHNGHAKGIRRFTGINRFNHALAIISFFGLTFTGIPLFFSDRDWANSIAQMFGGVHAAGVWHRLFAVMLIMNFAIHFVGLARAFRTTKPPRIRNWLFGPTTLFPKLKDFKDCAGMLRWFVIGGEKPRFDRWTYWEKFDYWAEIFGTMIIGGSGLMLWFPTFFSSVLPGWFFNIAMIVHGYEALLAIGFIFTIHFFNAHLRLEKFPVDDVIFTGQLSEEEFKHERPEEYERLVAEGRLETLRVDRAPKWQRPLAIVVGIVAMTLGMALVALIVLAGLEAL